MRYSYPCRIARDGKGWSASFPDVPEAVMSAPSRAEALDLAEEALVGALAGYVEARWTLPPPGAPGPGQVMVAVPPLVAAKLALYAVMQRQRITKVELARRLGVSDTTVHRIVDPEHRSHIDQVERALRAVGRTLVVDDLRVRTQSGRRRGRLPRGRRCCGGSARARKRSMPQTTRDVIWAWTIEIAPATCGAGELATSPPGRRSGA